MTYGDCNSELQYYSSGGQEREREKDERRKGEGSSIEIHALSRSV